MIKYKFNKNINYRKYDRNALVNYSDILDTYDNNQKILAIKYLKARDLRGRGHKLIEISKILDISKSTLYGWGVSKGNPYSLNCIKNLIEFDLLPTVVKNNDKFELILKFFGYIFTDGNISNAFNNVTICGELEDLQKLSKDIKKLFPTISFTVYSKKTEGYIGVRKIEGFSHILQINSVAIGRLLYLMGAPKGDKVKQILRLPDWIFELDNNLKKVFLGVLWSAEGSKPIRTTGGFNLHFSMAKDTKLIDHHIKFLNQIRKLFKEVGVETTEVKIRTQKTKRKDGIVSQNCYFYIKSNYSNFIRFYEQIPIFSKNKKEEFVKVYPHFDSIRERKKKRLLLKKNSLNQTEKLSNLGYSTKSIAKIIGIPRSTLRYWLGKF